MFFILVSLLVLAIGIILIKNNWDVTGFMITGSAISAIFISLLFVVIIPFDGRSDLIKYEQDKIVIELTYNNEKLTGNERTNAITLATEYNTTIKETKYWSDNFWFNIFVHKPIGELPLFDLTKINQANISVEINGN